MNIKFNKVVMENFLSIGDATVNLNDQGFVIVSGQNENPVDNAQSNGSGKSAIFEAIMWGLTGNTVRGTKDVVNKYATGGTFVGVDCDIDGHHFKIFRSKEHSKFKTTLKLEIDGEDKSGKGIKDTEKILQECLPDITTELIGSTTILGQGLPQRLTNGSPAERKRTLEAFAKSDFMCDDLKARVDAVKTENKDKLKNLEAKAVELTTERRLSESQLTSFQTEFAGINLKTYDAQLASMKSQLGKLNAEIEEISNRKSAKDDLITKLLDSYGELDKAEEDEWKSVSSTLPTEESISSKFPTFEQIDRATPSFNDIKSKYPTTADIDAKYQTEISALTSKIREVEGQIAVLTQDIKTKDSVTDICPTCGQKLPNVVKFDTVPLKKKLKELSDLKSSLESRYTEVWTNREKEKKEVESRITEEFSRVLAESQAKKDAITTEKTKALSELTAKKTALREDIQKKYSQKKDSIKEEGATLRADSNKLGLTLTDKKTERDNLNNSINYTTVQRQTAESRKTELQNKISEISQKIAQIDKDLLYINSSKDEVTRRLEIDSKMDTFLSRDFRGLLLTNIIDFIQTECYKFGEDIFHTKKIDFYLDGNNIFIGYNGKDYSGLSGGEKQKVDLIVQFALRSMLCQLTGFSTNILVLDEITDGLDTVGCQEVISCVTKHLTDVSSIYIISHRTDLNLPCDKQLIVRKNSLGISRVLD